MYSFSFCQILKRISVVYQMHQVSIQLLRMKANNLSHQGISGRKKLVSNSVTYLIQSDPEMKGGHLQLGK